LQDLNTSQNTRPVRTMGSSICVCIRSGIHQVCVGLVEWCREVRGEGSWECRIPCIHPTTPGMYSGTQVQR
jgi:hypothetical protein